MARRGAYGLRGEATAFVNRLPVAAHTVAQAIQRASRGTPGTVAKVQEAAREVESAASTATKKTGRDGITARVAISLIVGVAIWLSFRSLGLDDAGLWGVLSAVLFAVPIVGPVLVVVAAPVAAFVQFGSVGMAVGVGAVCALVGAVEGNVLTPWLMSRAGEMNAVAVFVSLHHPDREATDLRHCCV